MFECRRSNQPRNFRLAPCLARSCVAQVLSHFDRLGLMSGAYAPSADGVDGRQSNQTATTRPPGAARAHNARKASARSWAPTWLCWSKPTIRTSRCQPKTRVNGAEAMCWSTDWLWHDPSVVHWHQRNECTTATVSARTTRSRTLNCGNSKLRVTQPVCARLTTIAPAAAASTEISELRTM